MNPNVCRKCGHERRIDQICDWCLLKADRDRLATQLSDAQRDREAITRLFNEQQAELRRLREDRKTLDAIDAECGGEDAVALIQGLKAVANLADAARVQYELEYGGTYIRIQPLSAAMADLALSLMNLAQESDAAKTAKQSNNVCACGGGVNYETGEEDLVLNPDCPMHGQDSTPTAAAAAKAVE